jgi:sulfide:quinone oxidoreductase
MAEPGSPARVLIVGGGVAALETLMALRDLIGDRVHVGLVAPEPDFVYRPMAVAEPFGLGEARRYPLRRVAEDFGAELVQAGVSAVDSSARRVVLRSGDTMSYDTLVLATGARMLPAFDDALTFGGAGGAPSMRALLDELEQGRVRRVAFVAPTGEKAAARPLWWPPTKIAGRYLAPYLYAREPAAVPGPAPEGFVDLEVPLEAVDAAAVRR